MRATVIAAVEPVDNRQRRKKLQVDLTRISHPPSPASGREAPQDCHVENTSTCPRHRRYRTASSEIRLDCCAVDTPGRRTIKHHHLSPLRPVLQPLRAAACSRACAACERWPGTHHLAARCASDRGQPASARGVQSVRAPLASRHACGGARDPQKTRNGQTFCPKIAR